MIAYLVLGTGILLVGGSVLYTYRVDRKLREQTKNDLDDRLIRQSGSADKPFAQMVKNAQVKESIGSIGKDLDVLIDELKEKELEVKQIVKRVKGWQNELAATVPTVHPVNHQESSTSATNEEKASNLKYDQIARHLEEGMSVEEIARKLNMGRREVELVAKIRKKEATTSA